MEVPEHKEIRELARRFLSERGGALRAYEEEEAFPWPLVAEMAELGFLGVFVPEALGGAGLRLPEGLGTVLFALGLGLALWWLLFFPHDMVRLRGGGGRYNPLDPEFRKLWEEARG